MPYTILVTPAEAELLHAANVIEDAHRLVTFGPEEIMSILDAVATKAEPDDAALARLTCRLGTLMGTHIVESSANDESAQAHIEEPAPVAEPVAPPAPEKSEAEPSCEASPDDAKEKAA